MSHLNLNELPTIDQVMTALAKQARLASIYCELYPKFHEATKGQGAEGAKQLGFWMKRVVDEANSFRYRIEIGDSLLESRREIKQVVDTLYSVYQRRTDANAVESLEALGILKNHNFSDEQIESVNIGPAKIKKPVDSESNLTGPYDAACVMTGKLWDPPKGAKWIKQRIAEIKENESKPQMMTADLAMAQAFRNFHNTFFRALANEMGLEYVDLSLEVNNLDQNKQEVTNG